MDRAISAFDEIYMFLGTGRSLPMPRPGPDLASRDPAAPAAAGSAPRLSVVRDGPTVSWGRPDDRRVTYSDDQARALGTRPDSSGEGLARLREIIGSPSAPPLTVAALCEEFGEVCESAVDPLEIASALEFEGLSDLAVRERYGYPHVFALASEMYVQVPRQPAEPPPPEDPWHVGRLQPALHGLLYGLPAVCFPAAAVLLGGPGAHVILIVALLASWSASQSLASLGYQRLGRTGDRGQAQRLLRAGLLAGLVLVTGILAGAMLMLHARPPVALFGAGEAAYMLGACVLLVLGAERWLLLILLPGVLGSVAVPGPGPAA